MPVDTVCWWLMKVRSRPRAEPLPCALPGDPPPALPAQENSLFPSAAFSQTSATPLEGTPDFQVQVPLPWSQRAG